MLKEIGVTHQGQIYAGKISDETFQPVVMTASAEIVIPYQRDINTLKPEQLDTEILLQESDDYFESALSMKDDPVLAKERQKLAELKRQTRDADQARRLDRQRKDLEQEIQQQQQKLASMGGQIGDRYKGLKPKRKWLFHKAKFDGRNTVAVVIGNRNYQKGVPLVHYAINDAKAMRDFLIAGLGVPPENMIYEEDATKGVMEGIFGAELRGRIDQRRSDIIVYFSGHGMPDKYQDAKLLPTDARPNTASVTGYSRAKIMTQIAALKPRSMTLILDACFSGLSKNGEALTATKGLSVVAKTASVPTNGVLISASSGSQTAWSDDDQGMSLMTLHLLEGLSGLADSDKDRKITMAELRLYLEHNVNRAALRQHQQPQTPEIVGRDRVFVRN